MDNTNYVSDLNPAGKKIGNAGNNAFGVRPLITLKAEAKVDKTLNIQSVISRGNTYSYKVWTIK